MIPYQTPVTYFMTTAVKPYKNVKKNKLHIFTKFHFDFEN